MFQEKALLLDAIFPGFSVDFRGKSKAMLTGDFVYMVLVRKIRGRLLRWSSIGFPDFYGWSVVAGCRPLAGLNAHWGLQGKGECDFGNCKFQNRFRCKETKFGARRKIG